MSLFALRVVVVVVVVVVFKIGMGGQGRRWPLAAGGCKGKKGKGQERRPSRSARRRVGVGVDGVDEGKCTMNRTPCYDPFNWLVPFRAAFRLGYDCTVCDAAREYCIIQTLESDPVVQVCRDCRAVH